MKVAIVTGAGSGIGKASAMALLKDGYAVTFAGRRKEALEAAISESGADHSRALALPTDITQPDSVRALFEMTKQIFGRLDLLFNNAGMSGPGDLLENLAYEDWKASIETNLNGAFLCTQQAFRIMKDQTPRGGRIINNGSISAHVPRPNSVAYNSAKHGVTGLTRSTSLDGRKYDIVCCQIDIGNAATDMTGRMKKGVLQADGSTAPEPTMDVQLVARTVVHMASLPLEANIPFLTIMAAKMPFAGRG